MLLELEKTKVENSCTIGKQENDGKLENFLEEISLKEVLLCGT